MTIKDWLFIYFLEQYPYIGQDMRLGFKINVPQAVMNAYLSLSRKLREAEDGD